MSFPSNEAHSEHPIRLEAIHTQNVHFDQENLRIKWNSGRKKIKNLSFYYRPLGKGQPQLKAQKG